MQMHGHTKSETLYKRLTHILKQEMEFLSDVYWLFYFFLFYFIHKAVYRVASQLKILLHVVWWLMGVMVDGGRNLG